MGVVDDIDESVCSRSSLEPQSFSANVGSWNKWFIGGYLYLVWAGGVVGEGGGTAEHALGFPDLSHMGNRNAHSVIDHDDVRPVSLR